MSHDKAPPFQDRVPKGGEVSDVSLCPQCAGSGIDDSDFAVARFNRTGQLSPCLTCSGTGP